MTDSEILAKWRKLYPYISLAEAKGLQRTARQFGHLGALTETREREAAQEQNRQLRERLFGVTPSPTASLSDLEGPP